MSISQADMPMVNTYRSYLVRFWQSNEQGTWRASAQCVQSGNTILFGDVASLLAFLQTELSDGLKDAEAVSTAITAS